MLQQSRTAQSMVRRTAGVVVENLEGRCMMSAAPAPVAIDRHGLLDINGTRRGDTITVSLDHRHPSRLDVLFDGQMFAFKASAVKHILVSAGAGNDKVLFASNVTEPATLMGGAGDDTLTAGGGDDVIDGGTGDDQCNFDHNNGVAFSLTPAAVQAGLTTLAQGATVTTVQVFRDDGQTYYGAVVTVDSVPTRIVVDANGTPVSTGDNTLHNGGHQQNDGRLFGVLFGVDTTANTITVGVASEHGAGRVLTFHVDPNAVITSDGTATPLAGLHAGALVNLELSVTDATTVVGVRAFGRRMIVPIHAVDPSAGTITVPGEHGTERVLTVDSNATITVNGTPGTLADVTAGMVARIKFSADNSTVVGIDAVTGDEGHGGHPSEQDHLGHDF